MAEPLGNNGANLRPPPAREQPQFQTVSECLAWYIEHHIGKNRATSTYNNWKTAISHLKRHFGPLDPCIVVDEHVVEYTRRRTLGLIGRPSMKSTIRWEIGILHAALGRVAKKRLADPRAKPIFDMWNMQTKERFFLTRIEAANVLRTARRLRKLQARSERQMKILSDLEVFCWIALFSGQRRNAIRHLRFSQQVNFAARTIDFQNPDRSRTKKENAFQAMSPIVFRILRRRFREKPSGRDRVFGETFHPNDAMDRLAEAVRIKITPHTFKHTFVTWLINAGVDIWTISKICATSIKTLQETYGHLMREMEAEALRALKQKNRHTSGQHV